MTKKKAAKTLTSFSLSLIILSSPLYAADPDPMFIKAGRGIQNIVFGWAEIFYRPIEIRKSGQPWVIAFPAGLLKGIPYAVARTGVGVYETLTFPFPYPNNYGPIMQPESVISRGFGRYE